MLEVLGKPQDSSVVIIIDTIETAKDGHEMLVKYYKDGQEF